MDSYLQAEILRSLGEGNLGQFIKYSAIFLFIWVEVRGLKNEMKKLNGTIAKGFAEGDARFQKLERQQSLFDHRLVSLEVIKNQTGAKV